MFHSIKLHRESEPYTSADFSSTKITDVDATWLFKGRRTDPVGAHSDFWHHESMYLVLSLAEYVRKLG